jgi:hypothetical protein
VMLLKGKKWWKAWKQELRIWKWWTFSSLVHTVCNKYDSIDNKMLWEVITVLNVANLFHWSIIISQHNPWRHWVILTAIADVYKFSHGSSWAPAFRTSHEQQWWFR